jgi:hypothetical protein
MSVVMAQAPVFRHRRPLSPWATLRHAHRDQRLYAYDRWASSAALTPLARSRIEPTPQ